MKQDDYFSKERCNHSYGLDITGEAEDVLVKEEDKDAFVGMAFNFCPWCGKELKDERV